MADTWFKIKVWTKLVLLALVILFILLFTLENYSLTVDVWLFKMHNMTVLELLVATFLLGVLATLLAKPTYRTLGQIAQLRKLAAAAPKPAPDPIARPIARPIAKPVATPVTEVKTVAPLPPKPSPAPAPNPPQS
jgi:hypothetical protein